MLVYLDTTWAKFDGQGHVDSQKRKLSWCNRELGLFGVSASASKILLVTVLSSERANSGSAFQACSPANKKACSLSLLPTQQCY